MSSTETSLIKAAKKQYNFKLKSYMNLFISLAFVQGIAILFSLGGVGGSSTSSDSIMFSVKSYSSGIIIGFTLAWIFFTSLLLTTKEYRDVDFSFVTNRLSSNLSNIGFLVTAAVAGGLTSILGGVLLRVITYFYVGPSLIVGDNFFVAPGELIAGFAVTALYLFLLSSVGYFCGVLVQLNKAFTVILPTLFFGSSILAARSDRMQTIVDAGNFIFQESSLPLLAFKIILVGGSLFYLSIFLSNKLEVRK